MKFKKGDKVVHKFRRDVGVLTFYRFEGGNSRLVLLVDQDQKEYTAYPENLEIHKPSVVKDIIKDLL